MRLQWRDRRKETLFIYSLFGYLRWPSSCFLAIHLPAIHFGSKVLALIGGMSRMEGLGDYATHFMIKNRPIVSYEVTHRLRMSKLYFLTERVTFFEKRTKFRLRSNCNR